MPVFFCKEHGVFGAGSKLCECLRKQLKEEREEVARAFATPVPSRKTKLRSETEIKERLDNVKARIRAMSEDDGFINIESDDKDRDLILQGLLTTMFELAWVLGQVKVIGTGRLWGRTL